MFSGNCVLLSTSDVVRKSMKAWDSSGEGHHCSASRLFAIWGREGGIRKSRDAPALLLFALGCLTPRPRLLQLGLCPLGSRVSAALSQSKLAAGCYGSGAFRAAVVRAVRSRKMPRAGTPAILRFLDCLFGADLVFHFAWCRFRLVRRCLARRPGEAGEMFRLLDDVSAGVFGHGPVHLLLASFLSRVYLGFLGSWLGEAWLYRFSG